MERQVCLVLVMWLINLSWAALNCLPIFFSLYLQMTGNHYLRSVVRTPAQLDLRNTTTLFVQGIFSSVQYFGRLMFDLVEFVRTYHSKGFYGSPSAEPAVQLIRKKLWWKCINFFDGGTKSPQNWFDVSLPLNLKEAKFLFTLIEARCGKRKENP